MQLDFYSCYLKSLYFPEQILPVFLGFVLIGVGIWQAYAVYGGAAGTITLGITIVLSFIALYFALKSKTWKKAALSKNIDSKVNVIDTQKIKPGDKGITVSRLAPMGKANFNEEYYEVKTTGEFYDPGTKIEVVKIEFNKILVKKTK